VSRRALAWTLIAAYGALVLATLALIALGANADELLVLAYAGWAVAGGLIALRRPDNAVGWILLGIALAFGLNAFGESYAGEERPGRTAIAWTTSSTWFVWITLNVILLPLVYPHGRLDSPAWRKVVWLALGGLLLSSAGSGLAPGRIDVDGPPLENPLGVEGGLSGALLAAGGLLLAASAILAAVALVRRFRRARGRARQQIKWFALVVAGAVVLIGVALATGISDEAADGPVLSVPQVAWLSALVLMVLVLPATTAMAILRHRLYDIDVVIRRTLVYGALTATLAATYLGLVLLSGLAVGESDVAIAVATLAVAALFQPARARIQAAVDRRFYRRRYDAARTLEAFGRRQRQQIDLEALGADLRGVVRETVQPAHVSLWLRRAP
jgi:fumarate reductase subunit D